MQLYPAGKPASFTYAGYKVNRNTMFYVARSHDRTIARSGGFFFLPSFLSKYGSPGSRGPSKAFCH